MDRQLQTVLDTIRIPFYQTENSNDDLSDNLLYDQFFQNLIPQFSADPEGNREQFLVKRPGMQLIPDSNFLTGLVNDELSCFVMDAIPMTALYDVYVIAVFDTSNSTIYIIMARPSFGTYVRIGDFTVLGMDTDDYCFLTEFSQSSAGSLFPAVAVAWTDKSLQSSKGYYAISGSGVFTTDSLTEITDTGFPPKQTPALITMGRFVMLNSVMYIASLDGRIFNSVATGNDITSWTSSTSQIGSRATDAYPDQCIGLVRYKHHVVAFGRNTVQFFDDVGDTPSPLQPTQQAFIKFGAKSPRMIRNVNDVIYWIGYGESGVNGLWMLDGYTPTKLSTSAIDTIMTSTAANNDPSSSNMQVTTINNRPTLILNGLAANVTLLPSFYPSAYPTGSGTSDDSFPITLNDFDPITLCYNIVDRTWWLFKARVGNYGLVCAGTDFATPVINSVINYYGQLLLYQVAPTGGHISANWLYQWCNHLDVNQDEMGDILDTDYPSTPITTVATTNPFWFTNEKRKRANKLKVIGYIPSNSTDFNVYSMYFFYLRNVDGLGTSGTFDNLQVRGINFPNSFSRYYINNLGMGRAWTFCVVEKSKLPVKYKALEVDIQQGSH